MEIKKAIEDLEEYVRIDKELRQNTADKSDFDKFCDEHIEAIETVLKEIEKLDGELYSANCIISDYIDEWRENNGK